MVGTADSIPRALLTVTGIQALLKTQGSTMDEPADEGQIDNIIDTAEQHRSTASTHRLGRGPPKTQGVSGGVKQLKAKSVVTERKTKKDENEMALTGVRISGQIWMSQENKMNAVSGYSVNSL
jgi:hypothetical protein